MECCFLEGNLPHHGIPLYSIDPLHFALDSVRIILCKKIVSMSTNRVSILSREVKFFLAYRFALQYYRSRVSSRSELLSKFGDPRGPSILSRVEWKQTPPQQGQRLSPSLGGRFLMISKRNLVGIVVLSGIGKAMLGFLELQ
jgi:hypothetical protein